MLHAGVSRHLFSSGLTWPSTGQGTAWPFLVSPGMTFTVVLVPRVQGRVRRVEQDEEIFLLQLQTRQISAEK